MIYWLEWSKHCLFRVMAHPYNFQSIHMDECLTIVSFMFAFHLWVGIVLHENTINHISHYFFAYYWVSILAWNANLISGELQMGMVLCESRSSQTQLRRVVFHGARLRKNWYIYIYIECVFFFNFFFCIYFNGVWNARRWVFN